MEQQGPLAAAIDRLAAAIERRAAVEERRADAAKNPVVGTAPEQERKSVPQIVFDAVVALGGRATYEEVERHTGRSFSSVYNALQRLTYDKKLRKSGRRGSFVWEVV